MGRAVFTGRLILGGEVAHPINPIILSQTRTTFSLIVLLVALVGRRGWKRIQLPAPDLIQCCALGMLGVAASNYFYYVAIQKTSVAIAIILQYTAPVWVLCYVVARGQQKLSVQRVTAIVVAIAGIALTIGVVGAKSTLPLQFDSFGLIAALLASFSFAFYNLGAHRVLARHDRWRVLIWTLASAAIFWLVVNPPWKIASAHYSPAQWVFLRSSRSYRCWVHSLCISSRCNISSPHEPSSPVVSNRYLSILLATSLLGEGLRWIQTLGIVLVLSAIVIVPLPEKGVEGGDAVVIDPIE